VRIVAGVTAAFVAAVSCICGLDGAFAQTDADGAHVDHFLLFSGFDLWRNGGFLHGGMLWSPGGLSQEGFTLKLLIGGGQYRYQSGENEITGHQTLGSAMPGWRFKSDRLEVVAFVGADVQSHRLSPDDLGNKLRGLNDGLRAGMDLWFQPSDTMMLAGSLSWSSIGTSFWTRGAAGLRAFDWFWVGPEVAASGDTTYQQFRAGAHVTSFKTGDLEWSFGAGYVRDSDRRDGAYGRIWVLTRK
jgi:hypothetical protein